MGRTDFLLVLLGLLAVTLGYVLNGHNTEGRRLSQHTAAGAIPSRGIKQRWDSAEWLAVFTELASRVRICANKVGVGLLLSLVRIVALLSPPRSTLRS
jgi:hypothetical protein